MYRSILLFVILASSTFAQSKYSDSMYSKALVRRSTAPLYVLFTLHNDKTGEDRVVCTVGPFLLGAIEMQYGKQFEKRLLEIALRQPGHRFTFKNPKALKNIEAGDTPEKFAEAREYLQGMSDAQLRQNIANGTFDHWCQRSPGEKWDVC